MASAEPAVVARRSLPSRNREEVAFLPAALEIVETPPSPIGRAISAVTVGFFCLAVAWASWAHLDIVASATGKIVPSGSSKVVQPLEIGVVRAIHVQDGQLVKAGDILVELDPTMTIAELSHLKSDLVAAQLDVARARAALTEGDDPLAEFHPPESASPSLVQMHRQYLMSQASELRAKLAVLARQREQKDAERATIAASIGKLEATIPVVEQRYEVRKILFDKEIGARLVYLEALQQLVEQQQDLAVQKSRYREATAALAAIDETRGQTIAEYRRTRFAEYSEAERKVAGLAQDLIKAEQRTKLQALAAPVEGVVQQLVVHTVGGVVTPGQALMVVVPTDSRLEIEATVSNRDIGFIHAGQEAEIKIDTFNFTRYGLLHGKVLTVSQDSITRDKPPGASNDKASGVEGGSSEPKGQELSFSARVSLDRTSMQVDERLIKLSPGMAVTVEIKTGSRTVMNYLLSPLRRHLQDSLRER